MWTKRLHASLVAAMDKGFYASGAGGKAEE